MDKRIKQLTEMYLKDAANKPLRIMLAGKTIGGDWSYYETISNGSPESLADLLTVLYEIYMTTLKRFDNACIEQDSGAEEFLQKCRRIKNGNSTKDP